MINGDFYVVVWVYDAFEPFAYRLSLFLSHKKNACQRMYHKDLYKDIDKCLL